MIPTGQTHLSEKPMDELEKYLDILFDGLEGYVYSPIKFPDSWQQNFFNYPTERSNLLEHLRSNPVGDIYISPAVYSRRDASKESIKDLQVAWVEFDGNEQINYRNIPIPTAQIQTSLSTHLHSYWRLEPTQWTVVEDLNRRLTHHLNADSSGWDATQLLRPPGTINHKRNLPVKLVSIDTSFFSLPRFDSAPAIRHEPKFVTEVGDLKSSFEIITQNTLPNRVLRMIKTEVPPETTRSSFLAKLASELAEEGLSHIDIVSLLYETDKRVGKYSGRNDQMVRLSQLADYALHKLVVEDSVPLYTVDEILNHTEDLTWVLPPWLHTSGQLILSSAPGVGKTQMSFQVAYSILEGTRFLGMKSETSITHSILFMSLEMDKRSLKYILSHQKNEWKNLPTRLYILDETTSLTMYENLIEEKQITLLIVDNLTELFDESSDNPNAEARRVMKWCRKIRRRYGLAVILIHHNRKATEGNKKPKGLADLAGSFQFAKDSDTVVVLWEDHKGMELSTPKVRYGQKQEFFIERNENLWFRRKDGKDTDGDEPVQSNPNGASELETGSSGHGDNVDGSVQRKGVVGFNINFGH